MTKDSKLRKQWQNDIKFGSPDYKANNYSVLQAGSKNIILPDIKISILQEKNKKKNNSSKKKKDSKRKERERESEM